MDKQFPNDLEAIRTGLDTGDFSSEEITLAYLRKIETYDKTLNSFITVTAEIALEQARAADKLIAANNAGALTGIPFAHKDIFCTLGVRTSCGSRMLDNFVAPYDAHVTEKLKAAGMVMLGKTNMDEFAMGSSNESSYYGPSRNPWSIEHVPGGSSGGSAAAVAAGLAPCATGTDTGGSIRQPAAFCGISGLKPTYGRVSRYGMIAFASSLDQGGPMAPKAADLGRMLNGMAGFDQRDSTSLQRDDEDFTRLLGESIKGMTIGVPQEFMNDALNPQVREVIEQAFAVLRESGVTISEISLPNIQLSIPAYYVIAPAECSSNLSRYDGVRFGYRCEEPRDLEDLYERSRSEAFGEEVKRRILVGTYALSSGYYDAYYRKAQQIRRLIRNDLIRAFESVDMIMGPTSPTTAFRAKEKTNDPIEMYLSDVYTTAANLAGLPALSMPCGFTNGLPIGLQLIGNDFDEARMIAFADAYQANTDWHKQRPSMADTGE